jgi:lipoyl(octanoyl) transferase
MSRSHVVVRAYWLAEVPYREAWDLQRSVVEAVRRGEHPGALLLLQHPHVFTIGRRGDGSTLLWSPEECARRGVELVWTDRGGDATYHGPGQLVGYPILDLVALGSDILRHIRSLEQSLIAFLRTLGVDSEAGAPGMTGVWSQGGKVAAIGVKLNQRVTSHGFALNLTSDLGIFNAGIVPCGLVGKRATSVLELGGPRLEVAEAAGSYPAFFADTCNVTWEWADPDQLRALPAAVGDRPATSTRTLPMV